MLGLTWALWEGRFMALGCTLTGFMAWGVNRQQTPLAALCSHGPLPAVMGREGVGNSLGSMSWLSWWGCWVPGSILSLAAELAVTGRLNSGPPQTLGTVG